MTMTYDYYSIKSIFVKTFSTSASLIIFYIISLLLSTILIVLIMRKIQPISLKDHKKEYVGYTILYIFFSAVFPILGFIFSVVSMYRIRKYTTINKKSKMQFIKYQMLRHEKIDFGRMYGEGGAYSLAMNVRADPKLRIRSLVHINNIESKITFKINKLLLKEKMDDVRLYAYVLLEKKRKKIEKIIHNLEKNLANIKDPEKQSVILTWLLESYWQYIYFNLLDDIGLDYAKEKILDLSEKISEIDESGRVYEILGQLYLMEGELDKSQHYLEKAAAIDKTNYYVAEYLAEVAYLKRDFIALRKHLKVSNKTKGSPGLNSKDSLWFSEEKLDIERT